MNYMPGTYEGEYLGISLFGLLILLYMNSLSTKSQMHSSTQIQHRPAPLYFQTIWCLYSVCLDGPLLSVFPLTLSLLFSQKGDKLKAYSYGLLLWPFHDQKTLSNKVTMVGISQIKFWKKTGLDW